MTDEEKELVSLVMKLKNEHDVTLDSFKIGDLIYHTRFERFFLVTADEKNFGCCSLYDFEEQDVVMYDDCGLIEDDELCEDVFLLVGTLERWMEKALKDTLKDMFYIKFFASAHRGFMYYCRIEGPAYGLTSNVAAGGSKFSFFGALLKALLEAVKSTESDGG